MILNPLTTVSGKYLVDYKQEHRKNGRQEMITHSFSDISWWVMVAVMKVMKEMSISIILQLGGQHVNLSLPVLAIERVGMLCLLVPKQTVESCVALHPPSLLLDGVGGPCISNELGAKFRFSVYAVSLGGGLWRHFMWTAERCKSG